MWAQQEKMDNPTTIGTMAIHYRYYYHCHTTTYHGTIGTYSSTYTCTNITLSQKQLEIQVLEYHGTIWYHLVPWYQWYVPNGTVHVYYQKWYHVVLWFSVHMCALFQSESCDITL